MKAFPLKIVTPDGIKFDGEAEELVVRTTTGDLGILAGHINCVAPLGMGLATAILDGKKCYGACIGGMVCVLDGAVKIVPTSFEWAQDIDLPRAEASYQKARETLRKKDSPQAELRLAEARLRRALIRKSVAAKK